VAHVRRKAVPGDDGKGHHGEGQLGHSEGEVAFDDHGHGGVGKAGLGGG